METELFELVKSRRSTHKFTGEHIPDETIQPKAHEGRHQE